MNYTAGPLLEVAVGYHVQLRDVGACQDTLHLGDPRSRSPQTMTTAQVMEPRRVYVIVLCERTMPDSCE